MVISMASLSSRVWLKHTVGPQSTLLTREMSPGMRDMTHEAGLGEGACLCLCVRASLCVHRAGNEQVLSAGGLLLSKLLPHPALLLNLSLQGESEPGKQGWGRSWPSLSLA